MFSCASLKKALLKKNIVFLKRSNDLLSSGESLPVKAIPKPIHLLWRLSCNCVKVLFLGCKVVFFQLCDNQLFQSSVDNL